MNNNCAPPRYSVLCTYCDMNDHEFQDCPFLKTLDQNKRNEFIKNHSSIDKYLSCNGPISCNCQCPNCRNRQSYQNQKNLNEKNNANFYDNNNCRFTCCPKCGGEHLIFDCPQYKNKDKRKNNPNMPVRFKDINYSLKRNTSNYIGQDVIEYFRSWGNELKPTGVNINTNEANKTNTVNNNYSNIITNNNSLKNNTNGYISKDVFEYFRSWGMDQKQTGENINSNEINKPNTLNNKNVNNINKNTNNDNFLPPIPPKRATFNNGLNKNNLK